MDQNVAIADMFPGQKVEGFYILRDAALKISSTGKPFLTGALADRSGCIDIKMWDYAGPMGADPADAGKPVKIRGEVSEYKGSLQLTVFQMRFLREGEHFDVSALVPTAPIDVTEAQTGIGQLVESMEDEDYRTVARMALEKYGDAFWQIPAGKSVHHSFLSGLLMHTENMLRTADFLSGLYKEVIDRSLLLCGTLLHDMAKQWEFTFSELGMVTEYSVKGQLLGHLVMGAQAAAELCREAGTPEEKSVLLQHMILSHHGEPEFGAAVRPQCAEAELLSYIDLVDSRMEIYAENLAGVQEGSFSGRIFALEKKIYKHR